MVHSLIFYILAALITLCSVMVITSRNPVSAAIFLVGDLFLLAALYASMDAHFVAAIQVLVYAGAIVVLFIFVIMLLNLAPETRRHFTVAAPEVGAIMLTVLGFIVIGFMLALEEPSGITGDATNEAIAAAGGNTMAVAMALFTKYLWPFELASFLILLAMIASIVIAKKDKPTAAEKSDALNAATRRLA